MDSFTTVTIGDLIQGGGLLAFAWMVFLEVKEIRTLFVSHLERDMDSHAVISEKLGSIDAKLDVLIKD